MEVSFSKTEKRRRVVLAVRHRHIHEYIGVCNVVMNLHGAGMFITMCCVLIGQY